MDTVQARGFKSVVKGWLSGSAQPFSRILLRDRRIWVIAGLISVISAAHTVLEAVIHLPPFGILYFVPSTFFLIPAVYAAVNFGLRGALVTSLTATIITIPNWIFFHESWETLGCMSQLFVVNFAAYFIGRHVSRERNARLRVGVMRTALDASETKYWSLFDSSPVAIILLDTRGAVTDANPAAGVLFSRTPQNLKGTAVVDLVGEETAARILDASRNDHRQPMPLTLGLKHGARVYLSAMLTRVVDVQGRQFSQVVFGDVTEERRRQAGLRSYAVHLLNTLEEERQRIARELHDQTIQQLALVCREIGSIVESGKPPSGADIERLRGARKVAEDGVRWLRDFIRTLRPPILDDLGIVTSIRRLLADFKDRTGVAVSFKTTGEARQLSSEQELCMFRIAQEALWNIENHSRATRVQVTLTFSSREVSLDIEDNGVGFVVPSAATDFSTNGHFGLLGMQERTESIGGKLKIRSGAAEGTKVTASFPVNDTVPADAAVQ
ncbi:MAG: PAS domain-containing sensor histidine kinase [Chloroflexi bacterium]|nr:PAS domain-containing sensor histidine kinase [Chloroflexota bacterium]